VSKSPIRRNAELAENLWLFDTFTPEDDTDPTTELVEYSKRFFIIFGLGCKTATQNVKIVEYFNDLCRHAKKDRVLNLLVCT
jgi:hypothetical protein